MARTRERWDARQLPQWWANSRIVGGGPSLGFGALSTIQSNRAGVRAQGCVLSDRVEITTGVRPAGLGCSTRSPTAYVERAAHQMSSEQAQFLTEVGESCGRLDNPGAPGALGSAIGRSEQISRSKPRFAHVADCSAGSATGPRPENPARWRRQSRSRQAALFVIVLPVIRRPLGA